MKLRKTLGRRRPRRRGTAAGRLRRRRRPARQHLRGAVGSGSASAAAPIVVGSANFAESKILAEIYAQALTAKGVESSTKLGIGSREVYIKALAGGSISIVPEYTGNLLLNYDKATHRQDRRRGGGGAARGAAVDLKVLKALRPADQDVYVVTKDFSDEERRHLARPT